MRYRMEFMVQDFMMWTASHVDLVKEVVTFQFEQYMQVIAVPSFCDTLT